MRVECEKNCGCDVKQEYVHNDNSDTNGGERKIGAISMHRTQALHLKLSTPEKQSQV